MLKLFKVMYVWYEGEVGCDHLVKDVEEKVFEKDLIKCFNDAKLLVKQKSKKGDCIDCLPEYYSKTIDLMLKKDYEIVLINVNETYTTYFIDDNDVQKRTYKVEWIEIKE
jgi:hypothetical protein